MKNLNAARDLILLSTRLGECADCETPGVKCATPAGEIQTGDLRLVSVAEGIASLGLEILCSSAVGAGDSVCDACEEIRRTSPRDCAPCGQGHTGAGCLCADCSEG